MRFSLSFYRKEYNGDPAPFSLRMSPAGGGGATRRGWWWQLHQGMPMLNVLDCGANSLPAQALPLLAASSVSSAYYLYASGTSALPPRHHLELEWNAACFATAKNLLFGLRQFGCLMLHNTKRHNVSAMIRFVTPRCNCRFFR